MNLDYYIKLITGQLEAKNEEFHLTSSNFNYFLNPVKNLKQEILHIDIISNKKRW